MEDFYKRLKALGREPTEDTINFENTRLADKYLIFDLLAVGRHSTFYYGIEEASGKERVFKFYNLKQLENTHSFKEKQLYKRLSNYDSIHVLSSYDVYEDRNSKIIVSEYCNLGSLSAEIKVKNGRGLDELKAIAILKQIVSGLNNIHKQCGIIHKNLKAKNILIQDGIYKLTDFGLPSLDQHEQEATLRVPQIMMRKGYDQKAEVWNVGLLFHEMLFGDLPRAITYGSKSYLIGSEVKSVFEENVNNKISDQANSFLLKCLQTHAHDRMNWLQLVEHPIFQLIAPSPAKNIPNAALRPHDSDRMSVVIDISENEDTIRNSMIVPNWYNQEHVCTISELELEVQENIGFYEQKFNLQRQIRVIEKQLEQPYQKLGQYLEYEDLERASWQPLRQRIDKKEHLQYQELKDYYLHCLKVDFLFYDVIFLLSKVHDFENSREHVEFIYLLFSRCFFQMSQLNNIIEQGNFSSKAQNILVNCIKRQTLTLYVQIKEGWERICQKIHQLENSIKSRLFDGISHFLNSREYKRKNELLAGIEGLDYFKQEQIDFTVKMYQQHVRKYLDAVKDEDAKLLVKLLDRYKDMWSIKVLEERYISIRDKMLLQNNAEKYINERS